MVLPIGPPTNGGEWPCWVGDHGMAGGSSRLPQFRPMLVTRSLFDGATEPERNEMYENAAPPHSKSAAWKQPYDDQEGVI